MVDPDKPLAGRRVLVALTGGIACYKTAAVVSKLAQRGADVRVMMTDAATRFITPLTLQSLSGHPVLTSMWEHDDRPDSQHVALARWCELLLIAPCSANTLAKLATGLCDNLVTLTACALPGATPLLLAPAMNADMWGHPVTQRNLQTLRDLLPNLHLIGPEEGWQACRTQGTGRMSEPETIVAAVDAELNRQDAKGAKGRQGKQRKKKQRRPKNGVGKKLSDQYGLNVKQSRFSTNGCFFMTIDEFPAALWDPEGYIIIHSQQEFEASTSLKQGQRLNITKPGISKLPNYQKI